MSNVKYRKGDWVVYTKQKSSTSPGKRAQEVSPATKGDGYSYVVDKFWVVQEIIDDKALLLRTPGGKENTVSVEDPMLRKANIWEKLVHSRRFRSAVGV